MYNKLDSPTEPYTDKGTYVEIVGNGIGNGARSNARTLDWDGNEVLAGGLTANGPVSAGRQSGSTAGEWSFALGHNVTASGANSSAMG